MTGVEAYPDRKAYAVVAHEGVNEPAGLQIPKPQRPVARPGDGGASVRGYRHRAHPVVMAREGTEDLAGSQVSESGCRG
jgi:hypothetical protein